MKLHSAGQRKSFRQLVRSFRYLQGQDRRPAGFREFVRAAVRNNAFASHVYFQHLTDPMDEALWEWVEASDQVGRPRVGDYSHLPCLYDYTVTVNIYSYLLSGLGWAAKHALGLKGLLLIFDEAETLGATTSTLNVERGRNFLSAMTRVAQNQPRLLGAPHNSGLRFHKGTLPFLFKSPCNLKLMFGFTPTPSIDEITELKGATRIQVNPISHQDLQSAFDEIFRIYEEAYQPFDDSLTAGQVFEFIKVRTGPTRLMVKAAIEVLDLVRFSDGKPADRTIQ